MKIQWNSHKHPWTIPQIPFSYHKQIPFLQKHHGNPWRRRPNLQSILGQEEGTPLAPVPVILPLILAQKLQKISGVMDLHMEFWTWIWNYKKKIIRYENGWFGILMGF